jgi:hypothetical protein
MSDKTILKFTRAHGPYNKGDIAGFDAVKATALQVRGLARPHDAEQAASMAQAADGLTGAELKAARAELVEVADDLASREAALAKREAELDGSADVVDASRDAEKVKDDSDTTAKGKPPVQGGEQKASDKK